MPASSGKIVKVVLIAENLSFRKTHDIDELVQLLPTEHPLRPDLQGLDRFTPFAIAYRYPMDEALPEPTIEEVAAWREAIDHIRRDVVAFLTSRTLEK